MTTGATAFPQFDNRCLVRLPAFDAAAKSNPPLRKQRDVRRWLHRLQTLLVDYMVEGDVVTNKKVQTGVYVTVPEDWHKFEVSYDFNVQMPTALRLWGLTMANTQYRDQEIPWRRWCIAHAVWSIFFSQWARKAAHTLIADASTPGSVRLCGSFRLCFCKACAVLGQRRWPAVTKIRKRASSPCWPPSIACTGRR